MYHKHQPPIHITSVPFDSGTIYFVKCESTDMVETDKALRKFVSYFCTTKEIHYSISLDEFIVKSQLRDHMDLIYPNLWKDGIFEDEDTLLLKARRISHSCGKKDSIVMIFHSTITSKCISALIGLTLQHTYNVTLEEITQYLKALKFDEMNAAMQHQANKVSII